MAAFYAFVGICAIIGLLNLLEYRRID